MKTSTTPEAYCAEMNCDWQGEVPAVARCPKCNSTQVRRAQSKDGSQRRPTYEELLAQRADLIETLRQISTSHQVPGHVNYMCKRAVANTAAAAVARVLGGGQ